MKQTSITYSLLMLFTLALTISGGCGEKAKKVGRFTPTILENGEPSHITVQHILIAFKGSIPDPKVTRSKEEAETLAKEVFEKAKGDNSFDALVSQYTDDAAPGVYHMANFSQEDDKRQMNPAKKVMPRDGMVAAFGDVGFPLKIGEIGLAVFDEEKSKYGWHIIKRVR